MFSFFKSIKPKVTEKILKESNIKTLSKEDLNIDKSKVLAITETGKFYRAKYKNLPVSVKIIDITLDNNILNEFIYWARYNGSQFVLSLFGVCLSGEKGYIVLENFKCSLENALATKSLNKKSKIDAAFQCLKILSHFQHDNKKLLDIRPGVFGINQAGQLKLLDFEILINPESIEINQSIYTQRIKYQPPEFFNGKIEDYAYDIWSFGCLLCDIFSDDNTVMKVKFDDIDKLKEQIIQGKFPFIPKDVDSIIANLISYCFERDYKNRINIDELEKEYQLILETLNWDDNVLNTLEIVDDEKKKNLEGYCGFIVENIKIAQDEQNIINKELLDKIDLYEKGINAIHDDFTNEMKIRTDYIKKTFQNDLELKEDILSRVKGILSKKVIEIRNILIAAVGDILEIQDILSEMKLLIHYINESTFVKKREFSLIYNALDKNREKIIQKVSKYSDSKSFDKIPILFDKVKYLIDVFKDITVQQDMLMTKIIDVISGHKREFIQNSNLQQFLSELNINVKDFGDEELEKGQRMYYRNVYIKPQENTNNLKVFNIQNKTFQDIQITSIENFTFLSHSFSYYNPNENLLYCTGGLKDNEKDKMNNGTKDFFKFEFTDVFLKIEKFPVNDSISPPKISQLPSMLFPHSYHSMILINKNYLLVIGGLKSNTCEAYSIKNNKWYILPPLPFYDILNPSLYLISKTLFLFGFSNESQNHNIILSLFLSEFFENENQEIESVGRIWSQINCNILNNLNDGIEYSLRNGMAINYSKKEKQIYLFGGYDNNNNLYNNIFKIALFENDEKNIEDYKGNSRRKLYDFIEVNREDFFDIEEGKGPKIKKEFTIEVSEELLNKGMSFSNNNICFEYNYIVFIDNGLNCFEYDLNTKDIYYYN